MTRARTPIADSMRRSFSLRIVDMCPAAFLDVSTSSPLSILVARSIGTIIDIKPGINREDIRGPVVILPFIQSIIVVTSPIGDHAPPLLAAIIIILPYTHLSL